MEVISAAQARRIAVAAQGLTQRKPTRVDRSHMMSLLQRIHLFQIDAVNVFERSHYLPALARLGPYDRTLMDSLTFDHGGPITEYWAHEAAFIRGEDWPLFRWRMASYRDRYGSAGGWLSEQQPLVDWLRNELAARGPVTVSEIDHVDNVRRGSWWGWSAVKRALEVLFLMGEVAVAGRSRFQRRYALVDDVIPTKVLDQRWEEPDAIRELVRRAATAHGIGTVKDFADYFRLKAAPTRVAIRELVDAGELIPVIVPSWVDARGNPLPAWVHGAAAQPQRVTASALLSPFDPLVWFRERAFRVFGFHYRIEIYTPAAQRQFGYYSLPILLGDALVGRVDLKSDRQARQLRVQSAWSELGAPRDLVERLSALVAEAARWLGLDEVVVAPDAPGDLVAALRRSRWGV